MDYYRLNELRDTYRSYKIFTKNFEKWMLKEMERRNITVEGSQDSIPSNQMVRIAEAIAGSNIPLADTSGLRDIRDAIRTRKEVTEYYRYRNISDTAHPHFTSILSEVNGVLSVFWRTGQDHDADNEMTSQLLFVHFDKTGRIKELGNDNAAASNVHNMETTRPDPKHKPELGEHPLTKAEVELEHEFQVLCFLYDLEQLRQIANQAWRDCKDHKVDLMTAAVVTDLAQGLIQQRVAGLVEELSENGDKRTIFEIIKKLYGIMESEDGQSNLQLYDMFCLKAIEIIEAWRKYKLTNHPGEVEDLHYLKFLLYFDHIGTQNLAPPMLDNFTEGLKSKAPVQHWLPFGLQIVISVREIIMMEYPGAINKITDHLMRLAQQLRSHMEYEFDNWTTNRPEYMSAGETRFTDMFFLPFDGLLKWLDQLCEQKPAGVQDTTEEYDNWAFAATYPVFSGINLYYFHKFYHSAAISKTKWFFVALSHLYNACQQLCGTSYWPDLEFIIKMHGTKRIFVSDPPTDPDTFHTRLLLSMCASNRMRTKDSRGGFIKTSDEAKKKRGLMMFLTLEKRINDYYSHGQNKERWIRLHDIFSFLNDPQNQEGISTDDEAEEARQNHQALRKVLAAIIKKIAPKQRNRRKKKGKKCRVEIPNFTTMNTPHPKLLRQAQAQLQDHELHSYFDYLAFYRRAFDFITRIRNEVLYDHNRQMTPGDGFVPKCDEPSNFDLLSDLFESLKLHKQQRGMKVRGNEVSTEVRPINKLHRIACMMEDLIRREGNAELKDAQRDLGRNPTDLGEYKSFFQDPEWESELEAEAFSTEFVVDSEVEARSNEAAIEPNGLAQLKTETKITFGLKPFDDYLPVANSGQVKTVESIWDRLAKSSVVASNSDGLLNHPSGNKSSQEELKQPTDTEALELLAGDLLTTPSIPGNSASNAASSPSPAYAWKEGQEPIQNSDQQDSLPPVTFSSLYPFTLALPRFNSAKEKKAYLVAELERVNRDIQLNDQSALPDAKMYNVATEHANGWAEDEIVGQANGDDEWVDIPGAEISDEEILGAIWV